MSGNNIVWNNHHTPVSTHFNDIYFSNDDAINETHYVFIDDNNLNERFLAHQQPIFVIGETGFGSGLNFLITWQFFLQFRQQNPKHILTQLQFVSIEKYPLSPAELAAIHQVAIHDLNLQKLAKQLQHYWLNWHEQLDNILLTVFFDDITQFADHLKSQNIIIDAWFFDGFSPDKNPDMWSKQLFTALYQITRNLGTFATFTAAGQVRRNLIDAGFKVGKHKGFGKKREMLIGYKTR